MRKMIGAVLVVVVALSVTEARAQTSVEVPEYLREMPSAEKVIGDLRVAGRRESVARAAFGLEFLGMFIEQLSPHRHGGKWAPQESARMVEYENARRSLLAGEESLYGACKDDDCERYRLARCTQVYVFSAPFRKEVLDRFFSGSWQARYVGKVAGGSLLIQAKALPAGTRFAGVPASSALDCADGSLPLAMRARKALSSLRKTLASTTGSRDEPGLWDRTFGPAGSSRRNIVYVVAMVGVVILLLERFVNRIAKSTLTFPKKDRFLAKTMAIYWLATIGFGLSATFVAITNQNNRWSVLYHSGLAIVIATVVVSIIVYAMISRHRNAFLEETRKRYVAFRESVGSAEHQLCIRGSAIAVNEEQRSISLLEEERSKTYDFSDVRSWECRLETPGQVFGTSSAQVQSINRQLAYDAQDRSGLFVSVKDVQHAVWHVRIADKPTLDRWHEILTQALGQK